MNKDTTVKPNLFDFFLIALNTYLAIHFRGTILGWILTILVLILTTSCIYALYTGTIYIKPPKDQD